MILHYRTFGSEHPDGRSFLIRLAQDPRHLEEILASAESYLARVPDDHEALYYAGVAAFEAQKFPRCKQVISRLIEEHPELPYGWLLRSRLKRNDQESDGALADAERAAELAPKWADPYLIKALVFKQKRKPEAMLQAIKEARLRSPRNHQAAELYAEGLMLAGRFEEAVSELDRQILLDPWNTWPHLLKAQTLIEQGDPEAGLREARAHLHRSPKAGRLWAYVIQTLWMTGRRIEGETELDLAQAKYPGVRELNYLAAQGYDQFRRDMHRFMRRSVETGSFEELRGRFGYPSSESSPPKLPPDLGQNAWLKDKYQRLDPHPDLSVLQVPADAPFTIQRRDVRSYAMDILAMHRSDKFEVTGTHIGTTATFYTHSNKVLDTVESVIAYVESLLNFADGLGMRKDELLDPERVGFQNTRYEPGRPLQWVSTRVSIIFLDAQQNLFRNLLQELTKRYAQKLIKDAGAAHAYREVDSLSPLGRKIGLLARFVNNAYGVLDEEDKPLVQLPTMLVDELGHLIFARMRGYAENFGIMMPSPYLLAYDLGKNLINAAETRLPAFRELTEMHSDALGRLAKDNGPNQTIPFQRAVSDYRAEELLYRNPSQARAARLVWLLWAGLWDPHFYNSLTVENAPVDFDMERTLAPFLPVASIDLDIFTSQMVASFLQAETEAMDPYHRLSDFDLSIVAETIRRIQEFPDLAAIVKRNNFPSHAQFDGIRNPEDAFHYLDDKRSNQAAWLWRATAMTLMKLTGRSLTIDDLKTLCVRAGDSRLTNDAPRSAA
jgi:tetratricopeptide (TPR) repeat protein